MSAALHSFSCHVTAIATSPTGTAYALSHVFGNDWTGQLTVTRPRGDALVLHQPHGVTCVTWVEGGGRGGAAVFGTEQGDLVYVGMGGEGQGQVLEVAATASDFDAPVAGALRLRHSVASCCTLGLSAYYERCCPAALLHPLRCCPRSYVDPATSQALP